MAFFILSAVLNVAVCIHDNGAAHIVQNNVHQNRSNPSSVSEFVSTHSLHCVDISAEIEDDVAVSNGNIELPKPEFVIVALEWLSPVKSESELGSLSPSKIPPDEIVRGNIYNSIVSRLLI